MGLQRDRRKCTIFRRSSKTNDVWQSHDVVWSGDQAPTLLPRPLPPLLRQADRKSTKFCRENTPQQEEEEGRDWLAFLACVMQLQTGQLDQSVGEEEEEEEGGNGENRS
jgi:hypothetical protein